MTDSQLRAAVRAFLAQHYPWIEGESRLALIAALPGGQLVRVQLAAGMLQISVLVQPDGVVRTPRAEELEAVYH